MRRLPPAAQEDLRLRVVSALESGRVRTYGQAAEVFGVSERSAGTWWRAFLGGGRQALLAAVSAYNLISIARYDLVARPS
ncbi:helix-turn-helix domain-containing protein [Streptomyces sioyaensis]|uniref:helix-turn-helix domain-containing protein n=1 Tax=Streptomyces sioyaensis TaxID=67364 RepID=UPI0033D38ED1